MPESLHDLPEIADHLLVSECQVRQQIIRREFLQQEGLCHIGVFVIRLGFSPLLSAPLVRSPKGPLLHLLRLLVKLLLQLNCLFFVHNVHDCQVNSMG